MSKLTALKRAAISTWRNRLAGSEWTPQGARRSMLSRAGVRASGADFYPGVRFIGPAPVTVGEGTFINRGVIFDAMAPIRIGRNAHLAHDVLLITSSHEVGGRQQRAGERFDAPIHIGDGCWLGARVTVLPGVTVADGCIVAAGAVVTEDCKPHGLYGGIPARRIRDLAD